MEPYLLTEEDIRRLGITDAMAGEPATEQEIAELNKIDPSSVLPVLPTKNNIIPVAAGSENIAIDALNATNTNAEVIIPPNQNINGVVTPQPSPVNQAQLDLLNMVKMANQQAAPAAPKDPYDSLSKTQRRMLAFAGIRDAGLALQGKEGSSVNNLMTQFTNQADIDRKAKAALQTQQFLQGMVSPANMSATPEGMTSIEMLKARRDNILSQSFALDPRYMPIVQSTLTELNRQIKELETKGAKDEASATGARTVLDTVGSLVSAIEEDGNMITGPIGMILGTMPFTKAGEARLNIQTLKANLAFDALRGIKASGATLGAVSAPELALLEAKVANLDLNRGKDAVIASLKEIDRYYKQLIVNAYKISEDPSKLDAIFGERPAWADGQEMDLQALEFTRTNVPEGELIVDRDGGNKVYRYIGGPRNKASSYEEVN
ncbi:MAG: hypothetical protein CL926_09410 [Deltaproteobacteria bacterium]|nr:hypothetical protein [Deltaproteobacteria bacterium]